MRLLSVVFGVLLALLTVVSAQAASYRLRVGDALSISVWQDPKLDRQVVVGPDGTIAFPLAGHIVAAGQTLQAVEAALSNKLKGNYNTALDVTVALTATVDKKAVDATIYVTGEVNKPGAFPLGNQPVNALQAIALSGGFSPFAATSRIVINRQSHGQELQFIFNYRDFESGRDLSGNIDLRAGDVVVVPEKGLFGH